MDQHRRAVAEIAARIRSFYDRKEPFRVYHGSTNSTRLSATRQRESMVDISSLNHVLEVNTSARTVLVEPNVPMDQLVKATIPFGLIPLVVMEFPGITVGGGFAGTGGESSSFRYGFFDRTVNWCETVLADGNVVTASPTSHSDLFHGAAGAFGTLGISVLFEIQLIPAKTYVALTYVPCAGGREAIETIERSINVPSPHDYIDGIIFSKSRATVMLGRLSDDVPSGSRVQRFAHAHDPWFYIHASKYAKSPIDIPKTGNPNRNSHIEAIPLVDYLFRYDRGAFWTGEYAFKRFHVPFHTGSRFVLDRLMHTRKMYQALHASGYTQEYIIQDLALPGAQAAEKFISWVDQNLGIYPLWLCPLRADRTSQLLLPELFSCDPSHLKDSLMNGDAEIHNRDVQKQQLQLLNVGVWGPGPRNYQDFVRANRAIEHRVKELGGFKWLYANTYYTEDEFWSIYDRNRYDELRSKYNATTLPTLYEKVRVKQEKKQRVSGIRGVLTAMKGGEHLIAK